MGGKAREKKKHTHNVSQAKHSIKMGKRQKEERSKKMLRQNESKSEQGGSTKQNRIRRSRSRRGERKKKCNIKKESTHATEHRNRKHSKHT